MKAVRLNNRLIGFTVVLFLCFALVGCDRRERSQPRSANIEISPNAIDINTASVAELEALPGIGQAIANRIVEYRQQNGKFRKPEHLLLVPGISDTKFRRIRSLIRAD